MPFTFTIVHNFHGNLWEDASCCGYITPVILTNIWTKLNTAMEHTGMLAVRLLNVCHFLSLGHKYRDHIT
jgi:hypothetical protein